MYVINPLYYLLMLLAAWQYIGEIVLAKAKLEKDLKEKC